MNVVNPSSSFEGTFILFVYQVTNMHIFFWKCMQNLISKCAQTQSLIFHFFFLSLSDSLGGPFPPSTHRCHQKPKRCLPLQPCMGIPVSPLLFHPSAKGSQIVMDGAQRTVKRQASFCNAITFSNRPIALYEQVRLKVRPRELEVVMGSIKP